MPRSMKMAEIKRILKLAEDNPDFSNREIGKMVCCSKDTVRFIRSYSGAHNITYQLIADKNEEEIHNLFYPNNNPYREIPEPDVSYCVKELKKKHVTVKLLHEEYLEKHPTGLKYTQFKKRILLAEATKSITAHFERKPGERMEIDWSGDAVYYYDKATDEAHKCHVFVTVIGRSGYTYMEVFHDTKMESYFRGVINALTYFGGTPKFFVPDNDKSAVIHNKKYEIDFNKAFTSLADYYGVIVLPARVRKPKDKPLVENAVFNAAERELIGKMHDKKFYSFSDLSDFVSDINDKFNLKNFSKKDGSRKSVFIEEDLVAMKPLPKTPYELVTFKLAKVSNNYHIEYKGFYYSVPHAYIAKTVELRVNSKTVQIYYENLKIAEHIRLFGKGGRYSTQKEHMPNNHLEMSKDKLISWGNSIDDSVGKFLAKYFSRIPIEEQGYKGATGIISLARKNKSLLLKAIIEANEYESYTYKTVKVIFERLEKKSAEETLINNSNIRGEDYYKEKN